MKRKSSKFHFTTKKGERPRVYIVDFLVVVKGFARASVSNRSSRYNFIRRRMADFHAGHIIKRVFDEQGRTVAWFAKKMHCNRTNIYKMFEKRHLNSEIIQRASKALEHDFFLELSQAMKE